LRLRLLKAPYYSVFRIDYPATGPKPSNSSHVVMPSSGYNPSGPPPTPPPAEAKGRAAATLMEFSAPSTFEPERVHSTPDCHPGYVPPTGFLTLSTASSSLERSALFHAVTPLGFSCSPGGFPRYQVQPARHQWIALLALRSRHLSSSHQGKNRNDSKLLARSVLKNFTHQPRRLQGVSPAADPFSST
jgi:hypothetical protein